MDKSVRPLWQLLLLSRDAKKHVQLTCEEIFALLEYDVDLLAAGASFEEVQTIAHRHLSFCSDCRTKFDGMLEKLERDAGSIVRS